MTRYIGTGEMAALVRRDGPEAFPTRLVAYLRADFRRWEAFELAPRLANLSPLGVIELMPVSDRHTYAFKFVNGHPGNTRRGKLTVAAFGVLADVETGYPLLVSEMTLLTALRTAATSALAASALARSNSRVLALVGTGAQAEFQALAFKAVLGIEAVRLYDIDADAMGKAWANLEGRGLSVTCAGSVAEAVRGADIVTTATADKARATILTPDLIEPGQHLNAIGGDCPGKTELHADILRGAGVFVEYAPQTRIEGEIQQMPDTFPATELWRVIVGAALGRSAPDQVTVFDSVGFALEDFSALRCVRDLAGPGAELDLIPAVEDPKDLFGAMLGRGRALDRAA